MRRFLLIATCLLLIAPFAFAQNDSNSNDSKPYIEVNGNAEKWVTPDEIYISITIKERESGRKQITVEEQESLLKKALTDIKIPLNNLTVSDADADYIRVTWSKKDVISRSQYELKVFTAQQVKDVFEKLDELKIDNAYISRVDHSKITEYRKEVKINAITAAKEKADYLLKAIGQNTGKALIIKESPNNLSRLSLANNVKAVHVYQDLDKSSAIKSEITFRKIKLESNIYVKFGIE